MTTRAPRRNPSQTIQTRTSDNGHIAHENNEELLWLIDNMGTIPGHLGRSVVNYGIYEVPSSDAFGKRLPWYAPKNKGYGGALYIVVAFGTRYHFSEKNSYGCPCCGPPFKVGRMFEAKRHL